MEKQINKRSERGTFTLRFISLDHPELFELEFRNPLTSTDLKFIRGKTLGFEDSTFCFQWTAGMHALCILLISSKIRSSFIENKNARIETISPYLRGGLGSPAMTLEYSVGKKCGWLLDLFGVNEKGEALFYRFFKRINPGAKRQGDVTVGLNSSLIDSELTSIEINGQSLTDFNQISDLLNTLLKVWAERKKNLPAQANYELKSLCA